MSKSQEYRRNAVSCLRVAEQMMEPAAKTALIDMARAWHSLADQADKNSTADLVYEPPPVRAEPQAPVQQQQQQQQQIQPDEDEPDNR